VAFATAKLGAAITPLNFRLSGGEIATIIADAEPSAAVLSAQVARELGQSWAPRGLPCFVSAARAISQGRKITKR